MGSAIIRTGVDSTVRQDAPDLNFGTRKTLSVRNNPTDAYALVYFRNPAPRNATIISATLYLYGRATAPSATLTAYRIAAQWYQSWVKWSNAPGIAGNPVTVTKANADQAEWAFDVTSQIQTITSGGAVNYGFRISTSAADTTFRDFYSFEQGGAYAPRLEVVWSDAPKKPTTLSPSGDRAVSIAAPVLRFDYTDVSGSTTLAAVQVQIDAANDFTTPDFDSGAVAATAPELDLSATTYAGLANGASTYWRVRVQDGAGLWSSWSDSAQFSRVVKPLLTLDNPPPGASSFVTEPTPEIAWTYHGTQAYFQVVVTDGADTTKVYLDTGRRTGTDNSYTLPAGVLTHEGASYRVAVRAWDAVDRESTPGDPAFQWAAQVFAFQEDTTQPPPTGLAVASDPLGRPYATLTWARATAPDSFTILRDGRNIAVGLDPADCNTDPTHYRYVDREAPPNSLHQWGVRAVVNGVSTTGSWLTTMVRTSVLWLVDTGGTTAVPVLDAALGTFDMPELATVYEPVGGAAVIRLVQAQRGPQGTVTGRLTAFAGMTADDAEAAMLWFKSLPANDLRLSVGAASYHVIVGNVVVAPIDDSSGDRSVSFDWWSLDGVPS